VQGGGREGREGGGGEIPLVVVVGVRDGVMDELACKTLRALLLQSYGHWRAVVVVSENSEGHRQLL
jgi:hypothetical protein